MRRLALWIFFLAYIIPTIGMEYCDGNYLCEHGHCCGNGKCCTYYYEVWWFWVIWSAIALITGCCFYQQKRLRMRRQRLYNIQQTLSAQVAALEVPSRRSRRSLRPQAGQPMLATALPPVHPVVCGLPMPPGSEKNFYLPTYEEIDNLPKDPPAYDVVCSDTLRARRLPVINPAAFGLHDPSLSSVYPLPPSYNAAPLTSSVAIQVDTSHCARDAGGSPSHPSIAATHLNSLPDTDLVMAVCNNSLPEGTLVAARESVPQGAHGGSDDNLPLDDTCTSLDAHPSPLYTPPYTIDDRPNANLLENEEAMDENHCRNSSA